MDAMAANYDPLANINDSALCCYISGCTDSTANNYNPNACFDDNSCIYPVFGCMDSTAYNYNALADTSDGSCAYCVTTASAVASNASSATNADGSVDLTLSGAVCADTLSPGNHVSNYTATYIRGYYFQAQSSFNIAAVKASDGNTAGALATSQSVEIVDFGVNPPLTYPTSTGSHTVLYSGRDAGAGWLATGGVNIVAGNWYGVIGSKHNAGSTTNYNSYSATGGVTVTMDGGSGWK